MRQLAAMILLPLATSGHAQASAPPAPCSGPEFRTLDFWVGDWIAYDDSGTAIGTNRVTRDEYGDCVITEHFRMNDGSLTGHSVSTYRPGAGQWRQTWVDDQGGYFDLVGGPSESAGHVFQLENKRTTETQPHQRMIWQEVKPDSFTWRWQKRASAGEAWSDSWVIRYRRKPARPSG